MTVQTLPHPAGATVHRAGEVPARPEPRNLLDRAARLPRPEQAAIVIADALGLDPLGGPAVLNLSEPKRWARLDPADRLAEIAAWLRSECFDCMDLVAVPAVDTVGD